MKNFIIIFSVLIFTSCTIIRPPLIWGLTHEIAKVDEEFDLRVKEKFPVGTNEDQVIKSLKNQFFKVKDKDNGGSAYFDVMQIVCSIRYNIGWQTDKDKKIVSIGASVNHICL